MRGDSIPVDASAYAEFFAPYLTQAPKDAIRVLKKPAATAFWRARFGAKSTRYFNLPQGAWIDSGVWGPVGDWDAALSTGHGEVEAFATTLAAALDWPDELPVAYCISSTQVITTRWDVCRATWQGDNGPNSIPTAPLSQSMIPSTSQSCRSEYV